VRRTVDGRVAAPGRELRGLPIVQQYLLGQAGSRAQGGEVAVERGPAAGDDDDPLGERLDVVHVVAGQHDCRTEGPVDVPEEVAHDQFRLDVQADGRFVGEQQCRAVQQGQREFAAHPLAERQVADRCVQNRGDAQQLAEPAHGVGEVGGRDLVHAAVNLEGLPGRHVPPEHRLLPEDHRDLRQEGIGPGCRAMPAHAELAAGRHQEPAHHLDDGGLARPVGAEQADDLAALHGEVQTVDGLHAGELAADEAAQGTGEALRLPVELVFLAEVTRRDDRRGARDGRTHG
jgi:hypothetical protein